MESKIPKPWLESRKLRSFDGVGLVTPNPELGWAGGWAGEEKKSSSSEPVTSVEVTDGPVFVV